MKANPSRGILGVFRALGLHIDASSDWEVERALAAGFAPQQILLTSQMPSRRLAEHVERGVLLNACSLYQLEALGRVGPGRTIAVRMNPGLGSGSTKRTNTGGPAASFGIWHEYLGDAKVLAARHRLTIRTLHTHIGSGTDPEIWKRAMRMTLDLVKQLPDVETVNLGGGFKVGRMPEEPTVDIREVGAHVRGELEAFRDRYGRALRLEIEPGTYLVAQAGAIVATCVDVVDTGRDGYLFAKLDTGMTEITRPSLYGSQHPVDIGLGAGREPAEAVLRVGRHPHPRAWRPRGAWPSLGATASGGRLSDRRRRRRVLRVDVDHQLQLVPAGARGDARAQRYATPVAQAAEPRADAGQRGVTLDAPGYRSIPYSLSFRQSVVRPIPSASAALE
jgi:diaminopimelate decarboxylase